MSDLFTPIADFVQAQLEASRRIADALFAGSSKFDHAMLEATHHAVDEQLRFAQAIGNTRDPQTYSNLQSTYWASKPDELQLFQKKMVQILTEIQNDLGRVVQPYIGQMSGRNMRGLPPNPFGTSARSTVSPVNAFSGVMSAWQTTMRNMSSMAERAVSTTRTRATRAGLNAAEGGKAMAAVATTMDNQISHENEESDDAETEVGMIDAESHESGPHRNGLENRSDRRRLNPTRRK